MKIEKLIAEVLELDARATKGPFFHERGCVVLHDPQRTIIATVYDWRRFFTEQEQRLMEADASAFAVYRTAAPALARALSKLMPFVEHAPGCGIRWPKGARAELAKDPPSMYASFAHVVECDPCSCGLTAALAELETP